MPDKLERFIGRSPDAFTYAERILLAGKWIALERYTPATIPLRKIEAIGDSPVECVETLRRRGLNPQKHEFVLLAFDR